MNQMESKSRDCENQIDYFQKEVEGLRYSNDVMLDRNYDLKQELESLQAHADLIAAQNRDLQYELDSFVETDEMVK